MDKRVKPCPVCKTTNNPKAESKGYLCKPCASKRATEWNKNNKDKFFFNRIKAQYGITKSQYLSLLEQQDNKCAVCNNEETVKNNWNKEKTRNLAIDHCHKTGIIRGLLCYRCNVTLGKVEDSPELLRNLADYLERTI
jgi:hypothetical protein